MPLKATALSNIFYVKDFHYELEQQCYTPTNVRINSYRAGLTLKRGQAYGKPTLDKNHTLDKNEASHRFLITNTSSLQQRLCNNKRTRSISLILLPDPNIPKHKSLLSLSKLLCKLQNDGFNVNQHLIHCICLLINKTCKDLCNCCA